MLPLKFFSINVGGNLAYSWPLPGAMALQASPAFAGVVALYALLLSIISSSGNKQWHSLLCKSFATAALYLHE